MGKNRVETQCFPVGNSALKILTSRDTTTTTTTAAMLDRRSHLLLLQRNFTFSPSARRRVIVKISARIARASNRKKRHGWEEAEAARREKIKRKTERKTEMMHPWHCARFESRLPARRRAKGKHHRDDDLLRDARSKTAVFTMRARARSFPFFLSPAPLFSFLLLFFSPWA